MRTEDWPERLAEYLNDAAATGFVWGENDCLFFGANWVCRLTGIDPVEDLRGKWSSAPSALRVLKSLGFETYAQAVAASADTLGFEPAPPRRLQRGDLCFMADSSTPFAGMLGIVADTRAAFLTDIAKQPLLLVGLERVQSGWRIR